MIVGNGNVASALKEIDTEDIIFFASGVSDSSCTDEAQYKREIRLLLEQDRNMHLVYFSNLLMFRKSETIYCGHKIFMENLIRQQFPFYTIVRMEVIDWGKNPTTIHNVFRKMIAEGKEPTIKDETRYVLSKSEFQWWMKKILTGWRQEINVIGQMHSIQQIYDRVKAGTL